MLNISFLACTKVELWGLIIYIAVNAEKFLLRAMTLTLVGNAQYRTCPRYFHILRYIQISCSQIDYCFNYCAKTRKQRNTETRKHRL